MHTLRPLAARITAAAQLRPVFIFAVVLPALLPLLRTSAIPNTPDGLNHFYRIVELDWHIRHGVLYPRVMADLFHGFSYPLFNFYPPLAYYLALPVRWLGGSFPTAFLALNAAALYFGALGAFYLADDMFGELAGCLASAAVTYAPYTLFNVIQRGAIPEAWALALFPWLLWIFRRLALSSRPTARDFGLGTTLYAALLLSHNLMALVITPILVAWTLLWHLLAIRHSQFTLRNSQFSLRNSQFVIRHWASAIRHWSLAIRHAVPGAQAEWDWSRSPRSASGVGFVIFPLVIGLGLACFFWLPAIAEGRWVQLDQAFKPAGLDFHDNFISVRELFSLPQPFDPRLVVHDLQKSLGLPQAILAVATLVLAARSRVHHRPALAFLGVGALAGSLMALPVSLPLWESLRPLRFAQFPWRFLGLASVLAGILGGAVVRLVRLRHCAQIVFAGALFVVLAAYGLTWSLVGYLPPILNASIYDLRAYEAPGVLGTTLAGEYLPIWVQELPERATLADKYAAQPVIERLQRRTLPSGVAVVDSRSGLLDAHVTLDSPQAFAATFDWFYFPGWRAEVDGKPANIRITPSDGLISVPVAAGRHSIRVWFGETPLRTVADSLSVASAAALVAAIIILGRRRDGRDETARAEGEVHSAPASGAAILALVGLGLALARAVWIDDKESVFARSRFDGQSVSGVQTPLNANFGGELGLMGLDLDSGRVTAGGDLGFALYWRARHPLAANYSVSAHLLDPAGFLFGQADSQHPAGYATSWWGPDQYARDSHRLRVLPGTPPGAYRLIVGVYDQASGLALPLQDEAGNPAGASLTVAEISVTRPRSPPSDADLAPGHLLNVELGPLHIVGASVWAPAVEAGHDLGLTVFWRAARSALPDLRARLELIGADGLALAAVDGFPARGDYPTSEWTRGEAVRAGWRVRVPASAPEGPASVRISLVTPDGRLVAGPAELATVSVTVPRRLTKIPTIRFPLPANFENRIALLGYDVQRTDAPAPTIRLTLFWKALTQMEASYTVFTHLLSADGHLWAGHDSVPMSGTRPTSGWLPGEVVADVYVLAPNLAIPSGAYSLEAGWYDAATGTRLSVMDDAGRPASDHITLTELQLP